MKNRGSIFLVLMLFVISCNEPEQRIARSVGATSEILVVTQTKSQWDGDIGNAIRSFFGQDQYGLPQSEPSFKVTNINVEKLSDMFKKHRNLLIVETNKNQQKPVVETRNNLWAKPQRVIKITAADATAWVEAFEKDKEGFMLLFQRSERERLLNIFRPTAKIEVMEPIRKAFDINLVVPEGFYIASQDNDFMWLRKETNDFSQGIIIYQKPYTDTLAFSSESIIALRDSLVKKYIPGPSEGSYMTTDKEFVPPMMTKTTEYVTDFAVETRGMWNLVGDFMAGPFLSYTFVNPNNQKLLTVEGYVYAPNKDKRDHLRQLEALLFSLEFPKAE